jgi:hypothetical protein
MNDIEGQFLVDGVAELGCLARGGLGADDDFAMLKGDDVGRPRDVHKALVDVGDDPIRDDGDFDLVELLQGKLTISGILPAFFQRQGGETPEPGQAHRDGALAVLKVDGGGRFQRMPVFLFFIVFLFVF